MMWCVLMRSRFELFIPRTPEMYSTCNAQYSNRSAPVSSVSPADWSVVPVLIQCSCRAAQLCYISYNPHTHTHRTRRRRTQFERKQGSNKFMMMKYSVASMTHCAKKRRNSPICILSRSGCNFIIVCILILFIIHFTSNYYYITPFGSDDESIVYERRRRIEEKRIAHCGASLFYFILHVTLRYAYI